MAYCGLAQFLNNDPIPTADIIVTAVLKGGCPLHCPFCIISQRDERRYKSYVTTQHLTRLIELLDMWGVLGAASIVGDEPLQDQCWLTANAMLKCANGKGKPTALITNGYNLVDFVDGLRELDKTQVLVSLDAIGDKHDEIRCKPGAFARIAEGIKVAVQEPNLRNRISIAAILIPGKINDLREVIEFASANEIRRLYLSPLLKSSRKTGLAIQSKVMNETLYVMSELLEHAKLHGVMLSMSDECLRFGSWERKFASSGVNIAAPKEPPQLIRINASGRVDTWATMRAGSATALRLPADVDKMTEFVEHLVGCGFMTKNAAA